MGRSSKGGGSSGSFGGGGSSRGSFGGFSSSSSRSSSSRHTTRSTVHYVNGNHHSEYVVVRERQGGFSTMIRSMLWLLLIMTILIQLTGIMGSRITASSIDRKKLDPSLCTTSETWYVDNAGWIHDERTLISGLDSFYKKTGVQPLLVLPSDMNMTRDEAEEYLTNLYDFMFEDKGHLIWMYLDHGSGNYEQYYFVGNSAKAVINDEALHIIKDYVDANAATNKTDEEFFADSFASAGERMMKKTTSPWKYLTIIAVVGVLAFAARDIAKYRKEQAEIDKDILDMDL